MTSKLAQDGGRLMQAGQLTEAVALFEQGLKAAPRDVDALLGLGRCHLSLERPDAARAAFQRLLGVAPTHPEARATLAHLDLREGKAGALEALQAVAAEPDAPYFVLFHLGEALQERGDAAGAEAAFQRAAVLAPQNPHLQVELGLLALNRGEAPAAATRFAAAAKLLPGEWVPRQLQARALVAAGDANGALAVLKLAVLKHPKQPPLMQDLMRVALALGDTAAATAAAVNWRQVSPEDPNALYQHGLILFSAGQLPHAKAAFEKAVARAPSSWEAKQALAKCHTLEKRLDVAVALLEDAVKLAPTEPGPCNDLASLYLARNDAGRAEGVLRTLLAAVPDDDAAHLNLALALVQAGKKDAARPHVKRAQASRDPDVQAQAARLARQVG